MPVTRHEILALLKTVLEPQDGVCAMWRGGSAARGESDEWSDIDAVVVCEEENVDAVFDTVEAALPRLSPIDLVWKVPEPTWHGHAQRFYRLVDAPDHLLIDLVVMIRGSHERFLVPERHGLAVPVFDKVGLIKPAEFDAQAFRAKMRADLADTKVRFEILQCMVDKEIQRGRPLDALNFYFGLTLTPLIKVLGMRYRRSRYDFGRRYTREDFPTDVADKVEALHFVRDLDDLETKHDRAQQLFWQTVQILED
ncbi:nucleotidyltransferase domain-containing protein [Persicimonas caeni]|uniref:Nucleotidyltransferase domain-containing protein n=1 Tax=Persicimonas caeni TaxID=2292766 RepID=A0A4Y6PQT9_PERCE|nr:nucleotidyltransferase domain-containing protein [Persicimonas caeni]QDG50692.1 nucleotidyltransferase domain-containing protein [Persicimonas caeni]QED31913.1 nucleotidyltransferase domain-containing protein [Persicimonas caeni]